MRLVESLCACCAVFVQLALVPAQLTTLVSSGLSAPRAVAWHITGSLLYIADTGAWPDGAPSHASRRLLL